MQVELINFAIERQRHDGFVGRAALLARLDQLLIADRADRWVVVTGGPGMGKSALLAAWLKRREAAGDTVPHHFIRRGEYDWDDPAKLVGSLVAQIEARYPDQREPETDTRMHPAARLGATLRRVSESELASRGERLVVLVDGLDEYDAPPEAAGRDPLAAFLPHALPHGVSFLCASRPRHPYVDMLAKRGAVQLDLDDKRAFAADNETTVRAFWKQAAPQLSLDAQFIDQAVALAGGNMQHASMLRQYLAGLLPEQRCVEKIPQGLAALLSSAWERIATNPLVVDGLGILCAAREALTLDELGAVAGWTGEAQRWAFVRDARELLIETRREGAVPEYRLHHDSIRAHVAGAIGTAKLRGHHSALAQKLATWPALTEATARRYALRYALFHRAEAGEWANAWCLAADMSFMEARCRELGAHEVEADVMRVERSRSDGDATIGNRFSDLARSLARESHWLRVAPEATAAVLWNRLRRSGWSEHDLNGQLRVPVDTAFLRVRNISTRESPALVRDLIGHSGGVRACVVTPDGRRVISASEDRTLKVWDLETGIMLYSLEGHARRVTACVITPDGRQVVSASEDRTLKVWDLESRRILSTLTGHTQMVNACAVTPDERRVVSASWDRTLRVWDLESGRGRARSILKGHASGVTACAVTPDGRRVVSASWDRTLKVWDLESGSELVTLKGHIDRVTACAVTSDGRRVVSASEDQTLKVWDLESGSEISTLEGHADWVSACAMTPDGRRVVSVSHDRTLRVWDLESRRTLATLAGHTRQVNACAITPDGRYVVSASHDKMLKVWDSERALVLATVESHTNEVGACAMMPDGRRVVSASHDKTLKVWDLESGRTLSTLKGHRDRVRACAVTPDGQRLVSASYDKTLKVWDLESGRELATLEGHADMVTSCAMVPDGRRAVSGSHDNTLMVWDLENGRALATLEGHAEGVRSCVVTPDGQRVISASEDKTLKVWDLESGRALSTLEGHADRVKACALTLDGRRVISASEDKTLKVWDLESGRVLSTLEGHADWVSACAMTPDGRRVVSASYDRTLKVWDLTTYTCLFTHRGDAPYLAVAVAAGTTGVVAGDSAGGVWFIDWPLSDRRATQLRADDRENRQQESRLAPETSPSRPIMKKHTILFLAANPTGTSSLALGEEARAIRVVLQSSSYRNCFELETRWAVRPLDLLHELQKLKPTVVHFSGHGGLSPVDTRATGHMPRRDVISGTDPSDNEPQRGLFFQSPDGRAQVVTAQALHDTFGTAGSSVKLVVLSACYSDVQAEALRAHVDCVVGMSGSIGDDAARNFAIGFYGGLGEREPIAAAFGQGCAAISLEGLHDSDQPKLRVRDGVDADKFVLGFPVSHVEAHDRGPVGAQPQAHHNSSSGPASPAAKVEIGILTIRDDEFDAVLKAFPQKAGGGVHKGASRQYILRHAEVATGERYTVAILRQVEQGTGEAQHAARDLIEDLAPKLVLVVGIAGGLPSDDVTLGDVVLGTRIHDYTVEAVKAGHEVTYAATGGPIDQAIAAAVATLRGREDELGDWTSGLPPQPAVAWTKKGQVYGPPEWQRELRAKLEHQFAEGTSRRPPTYVSGPIASSDRLVKDPAVLFPWITTARNLLAIEMESGGVYRAARERCPMLPIRGISDIVGLKRADAWTKYACASVAAFVRAFLRARPVPVGASLGAADPR